MFKRKYFHLVKFEFTRYLYDIKNISEISNFNILLAHTYIDFLAESKIMYYL